MNETLGIAQRGVRLYDGDDKVSPVLTALEGLWCSSRSRCLPHHLSCSALKLCSFLCSSTDHCLPLESFNHETQQPTISGPLFLCWLPLHVNKTVAMLLEFGFVAYSCSLDQSLLAAHPYVTCLAYINSCLNPFLYAACDPSFRRRCRGALLTLCGRCRRRGETKAIGVDEFTEKEDKRSSFPMRTQDTHRLEDGGAEERVLAVAEEAF
ncbi:Apelin receptor [Oryzias melastigma]|uniref:Apelin receptor n=1 Tax=Oryzias melastigma TaxID=30732 RepID=A0A834CI76_ORYME|nr:Apelin receptor [Oryzias melastigma]